MCFTVLLCIETRINIHIFVSAVASILLQTLTSFIVFLITYESIKSLDCHLFCIKYKIGRVVLLLTPKR